MKIEKKAEKNSPKFYLKMSICQGFAAGELVLALTAVNRYYVNRVYEDCQSSYTIN